MSNTYHGNLAAKAASHANITASGTGDIIDVSQYEDVKFVILTATTTTADGSNTLTFSIEEGDTPSTLADAAAVASDRVHGSAVINAASQDNVVLTIGATVGIKKYMRLKWTEVGTTDTNWGAIALLGGARHLPAQT